MTHRDRSEYKTDSSVMAVCKPVTIPGMTGHVRRNTHITYWDKLESIKAFSGNDISRARLYPEDEVYELEPDLSVQHYEVIEH